MFLERNINACRIVEPKENGYGCERKAGKSAGCNHIILYIDFIYDERKKNNQMFQNGFFDVFGFWMEFLGVRLPGSAFHKWNQSRRKKYSGRKYLLRTS